MINLQLDNFFNIDPGTVYGVLVGGMAIVISALAIQNRYLTKQFINLGQSLVEKFNEIKTSNITNGEKLDKIEKLIMWVRKFNKANKSDHET